MYVKPIIEEDVLDDRPITYQMLTELEISHQSVRNTFHLSTDDK